MKSWTTGPSPAAVLVCVLGLCACVAYDEPLSRAPLPEPADARAAEAVLRTLNLRLHRPELDDPPPEVLEGMTPSDVLGFQRYEAERASGALDAAAVFASVGWSESGAEAGSIQVEVLQPPRTGKCDGDDVLAPFLTAGLVPAICESNRGLYLRFANGAAAELECPWPHKEMLGWLGVLLGTQFGDWRVGSSDGRSFDAYARSCVLAHADSFAAAARAAASAPEPSGPAARPVVQGSERGEE